MLNVARTRTGVLMEWVEAIKTLLKIKGWNNRKKTGKNLFKFYIFGYKGWGGWWKMGVVVEKVVVIITIKRKIKILD